MGMSTHVYAIKPPNERWEKMRAIWVACTAAKVEIPSEVLGFFNHQPPDPAGVVENIDRIAREWSDDCASGLEVDLDRLPPGTATVRLVNSW